MIVQLEITSDSRWISDLKPASLLIVGSLCILAIAKETAGFIEAHDIALNSYDFDTSLG
jgi:hypothetical protein